MRFWSQPLPTAIELSESGVESPANSAPGPGLSREAFRAFYHRTNRFLWAYLLRVSGRRDVADDLLQESYCRFLAAKLPEMSAADSRSYLFRIATNLLHDGRRSREVSGALDPSAPSREVDPEVRTDVRRAMDLLKPRERQLLWLAHVEGFEHREISRLTGLRVASIRVLLFRARKKLASVLRERSRTGGTI
jgi:RNA polymerase sigma-70 factor (ECF subfamily)